MPVEAPPHDIEKERQLLGLILADNSIIDRDGCQLSASDFYRDAHQIIYRAAQKERSAGKLFDSVECEESLSKYPDAHSITIEIMDAGYNALMHRAPDYAAAIREKAIDRTGINAALDYIKRIRAGADPVEKSAARNAIPDPAANIFGWPAPKPLPDPMPPVAAFDYGLLPEGLRPWIQDIAERTQCPPDFAAVGAVVGLTSLLGRKIAIRPKRYDDWAVVPNLWGAVIGRPGIMKSPALAAVMKPLRRIECDAKDDYIDANRDYEAAKLVAEESYKSGKSRIKETIKHGGDAESVARGILNDCDVTPPARRRCLVNDTTIEKLGEILSDNPNGFLVFRDELTGFLRALDRDGQEGARSFYLESWNGDGKYTFDRIGRGTIDIDAAITSILGGIQPGPIADYVRGAASDGRAADGLLQRFQLVCWPDISRNWKNVDRWPDTDIKNRAHEIYQRLDALTAQDAGCVSDEDEIPYLRFDQEAQERFDAWRASLELQLRCHDDHAAFEAHLSKYRSLIPSIALICHLAEVGIGPVGIDSLERAIHWGEYLESHARRLYGAATNPEVGSAHALAKKISSRKLTDRFTLRDIYRPQWSELTNADEARSAVEVLIDCNIVRRESDIANTKPRTFHRINPRFLENAPPKALTKLTEPGVVSSVSDSPEGYQKKQPASNKSPELDPFDHFSPGDSTGDPEFENPGDAA